MKDLRKLFDYQSFERNSTLEALIEETKARYPEGFKDEKTTDSPATLGGSKIVSFESSKRMRRLSDDDMELLAAGVSDNSMSHQTESGEIDKYEGNGKMKVCPHCGAGYFEYYDKPSVETCPSCGNRIK